MRLTEFRKFFSYMFFVLAASSMLLVGCKDDEEDNVDPASPTGSLTVSDQALVDNMINVDNVTMSQSGWVVVHASNATGDGPQVPEIISTPVLVDAGSNEDVKVTLNNLEGIVDGSKVWVMLHTDNGTIGTYEFDGANGFDGPILNADEAVEVKPITLSLAAVEPTGSITVSDQIVQGNTITVESLTVNAAAWVVVHGSDENGDIIAPAIISEPVQLAAGVNSNVEIMLTENVAADQTLYVMLHTDNGTLGAYEFDGANGFDGPITTEAMQALAPTGSFTANDQVVTGSTLMVASVTVGQPSWVVVHKDDGTGEAFVAPAITSTPVAVEAGTTENIEVTLTEGVVDGERLWVMLHNDNGVVGSYEFDGTANLDSPITFSSIDVSVPNVINYDVVNSGTSAYLFTGNGLASASNPAITLTRGETYTFTVDAPGHPFYINSTQGTGTSNAYNDGVSNNGTQSGTVTFTVPANAPNTLFYNCEFHGGMTGTFTIVD